MEESTSLSTELLETGTVIAGRYRIERLVGSGGMASVYLAHDRMREDQQVALKILHRQFTEDKTYVKRFVREVQLMNKVDHPNVVKTYDIGSDQERIYFSMEYVPADSLEKVIDYSSFDSNQVAQLIVEICRGLAAIHRRGIIHRDLKPANVLVRDNGSIKITDFGVAREEESRLTTKMQKVGSVCYMAPEIWLGKKLTPSIDFYSLGVLLYEIATGDIPFDHDWPGELMKMHTGGSVIPPAEKNERVPSWLNELIMRLLAKTPKGRPRSADEIVSYVRLYALNDSDFKESSSTDGCLLADRPKFTRIEPHPSGDVLSPRARESLQGKNKTYVFQLTATRLLNDAQINDEEPKRKRKATVVIPLPRRAAVVIELEPPSRDFIFLGLFLASLQVLDGVFTHVGIKRFGVPAEGNPLLRYLMQNMDPDQTILLVKIAAVLIVALLTVVAKRMRWIKDLIGVLSCLYLFAAIIPWAYILFVKYNMPG